MPSRRTLEPYKCGGVPQAIEVKASIQAQLSESEVEETIIRHESDECPYCSWLSNRCFPTVRIARKEAERIIAVINPSLQS